MNEKRRIVIDLDALAGNCKAPGKPCEQKKLTVQLSNRSLMNNYQIEISMWMG
jgi:hypothetical protein